MTRSNTPASIRLAEYIGVPFVSGGRDPALGLDCWGLVLAVAHRVYGVALPDYPDYRNASVIDQVEPLFAARAEWREIARGTERAGDVIVLRIGGHATHAGLVIAPGRMLHTLAGCAACVTDYRSTAWRDRIVGFYQWPSR